MCKKKTTIFGTIKRAGAETLPLITLQIISIHFQVGEVKFLYLSFSLNVTIKHETKAIRVSLTTLMQDMSQKTI